jgi:CheY-like chemotaxis protein
VQESETNRGPLVLVAEDELPMLDLVTMVLRDAGYRTLRAVSGSDAIEKINSCGERIDLLLTDVKMPAMNGLELAERIAETKPGIPTLFMTGGIFNQNVQAKLFEMRQREGNALILKPFRAAELLAAAETLLARNH